MAKPKSAILREAEFPKIARVSGATTTQPVTPACGAEAFLSGFTDIPPGAAIPLHYHNCEEAVLVVSGKATVEVDGAEFRALAGKVVWQPENVPHRFINPSETETLRIYWTYASVNATRTPVTASHGARRQTMSISTSSGIIGSPLEGRPPLRR